MSPGDSTLSRLVAPLSKTDFIETYWERKSLVLPGAPGRFAELFALAHVGRLLHYLKPAPPEGMLLVRDSQHYARRWTNADGTPRPSCVREALGEGYSLIVNGIDRLWEPVERFALALQAELHHPVDVNLYVTPPSGRAFSHHWDIMDVFILQVAGRKAWQVREAAVDRPLPDEHAPIAPDKLPPLVFEGDIEPGGLIYIPRGHVHAAAATDSLSMHLSVGIHPRTWLDLMAAAIRAARADGRLRGALPPGYLDGGALAAGFAALAAELPDLLDAEKALDQLARDFIVDRPPPPDDDFLEPPPAVAADTIVRLRPGIACRAFAANDRAGLIHSGGRMVGPAKIGPALRALCRDRRAAVRDLEGLNEREAIVLATRLLRDGVLDVEDAAAE